MFKNEVAEFIYKRTYSRWLEEENRREDWPETIERFIGFVTEERPDIPEKTQNKIRKYMTEFAVMPSMRFLWAAGPAAKADNTTIYNCSFAKMNTVDAFAECLYVLMCGTGFGFSVENEEVEKLPTVPEIKSALGTIMVILSLVTTIVLLRLIFSTLPAIPPTSIRSPMVMGCSA